METSLIIVIMMVCFLGSAKLILSIAKDVVKLLRLVLISQDIQEDIEDIRYELKELRKSKESEATDYNILQNVKYCDFAENNNENT